MSKETDNLRSRAARQITQEVGDLHSLMPEEIRQLVYDLRIHQIELEMQNDELQRTQLELEESHARYVELYDYAPMGYLTLSPQGIILEANLTLSTMLATSRHGVIKQPLSRFVFEMDQNNYHLFLHKQKKNKTEETLELRLQGCNDSWFWAGVECRPILDGDEKVKQFYLTISDISKRKAAEDKLRQAAVVVDNTAEAILISDANNKIISVNKAFTDITGYTQEEVLGLNPSILKSDRHDAEFYAAMWRSVTQTGRWQGEVWDRRKNDECFPAWQTITQVYDEDGTMTNYVSVFSDISCIKQSQAELDFLAHHDPLTHLPNRMLFNDRLTQAIRRARRERHKIAVLFLDLDRFKNINDSLGHAVGDKLIQLAGQRIKGMMREGDTVARLGGDEFVVTMEELNDSQDVVVVARKLKNAFQGSFNVGEHDLHVSLSMGISLYPQDGEDGDTLIKNADTAMYRAKEDGRNNFQFYTSELTTSIFQRLTLETELRQALKADEIDVHFQPQYSLENGEMVCVEALARWHHPSKGLLLPARFITIAEESGLILPLGELVMRKSCRQMQQWLQAGYAIQRMAVNVSAVQLQRGSFVEMVKAVLAETNLAPHYLELEITESVIMKKEGWGIKTLNQLQEMGIRLTIDDFGTGFSSLSYLKRLPVKKIKIDQSFVHDIPDDSNGVAITQAIVAMSESLQFIVVAEGVETKAQHTLLKSLGCHEAQGNLFQHAVSAETISGLMSGARSPDSK